MNFLDVAASGLNTYKLGTQTLSSVNSVVFGGDLEKNGKEVLERQIDDWVKKVNPAEIIKAEYGQNDITDGLINIERWDQFNQNRVATFGQQTEEAFSIGLVAQSLAGIHKESPAT